MEFKDFHKVFFNSNNGAFSRVTEREFYDSQITLTDIEAEIVNKHFGAHNINIGNVTSNREKSSKVFLLYPSFEPIILNLVYPKPNKTELRLYLSSQRGFKPAANDIWFLYEDKDNELIIGSLPEPIWNNLGQSDNFDDVYQNEIELTLTSKEILNTPKEGKIITRTVGSRQIYQRDPRLAALRFLETGYTCEINPLHNTFLAQRTNLPYMEAHHFIPMMFQGIFSTPLDNFDNIVSLCPNCHRAIHHAIIDQKFELISNLYDKRPVLHLYPLTKIAEFYNCIRVPED